jgi:hypothetical protein
MTDGTVTAFIRKKLREEMNNLADHIAGGGCASFEEYKHACGKIEGLAVAEREVLDIEKRLQDD